MFRIDLSAFPGRGCCHSENLKTLLIDKDYSQDVRAVHDACVLLLAPDLCLRIYKSVCARVSV